MSKTVKIELDMLESMQDNQKKGCTFADVLLKGVQRLIDVFVERCTPLVKIKKRNPSLSHQEVGFLIISLPKCIGTEQ